MKLTVSDKVVQAMRNLDIKCSILTALSKLTDGGQEEKYNALENKTVKQIEKELKKIFNPEGK